MSSINQFPTLKYSQPDDYHFSHDSVFLARQIFEMHKDEMIRPDYQILDLCAGCGVVGIDLVFHQMKESIFNGEIDFLEVQEVYYSHFIKNIKTFKSIFTHTSFKFNWIQQNYAQIDNYKKYDLIISNPPYFIKNNGVLSDNKFKNRCRFYLDSDWLEMIFFLKNSLKKNGKAYFLIREELKKIIEKEIYFNTKLSKIQFKFQIRGTWVAYLEIES